jgi:hypothetical protein
MADTLTQLIAKIQAQLLDNATLFSTATCTAAARQALHEINRQVPALHTELIDSVASQKEYEITDSQTALRIVDVVLQGVGEYDLHMDFDSYVEDGRWYFRLRTPLPAGEIIIVHYTKPFTIAGLDSAADSTLTDILNDACIHGSCYFAIITRAAYTVENNNVNPDVAKAWERIADIDKKMFDDALATVRHQPVTSDEPDLRTWQDEYHNWNT